MRDQKLEWPIWGNAFLSAFVENGGVIFHAAKQANIARANVYVYLNECPEFKEAFETAKKDANDSLVREAVRRARDGWEEPVIFQGKPCFAWFLDGEIVDEDTPGAVRKVLTVNKRSDMLLKTMMQARIPEFRTQNVEVSGKDGEPIKQEVRHNGTLSVDINAKIDQLSSSFLDAANRAATERGIHPDDSGEPLHPDMGDEEDPHG